MPLSFSERYPAFAFADVVQAFKTDNGNRGLYSKNQPEHRRSLTGFILFKTAAALSILRPLLLPSMFSPLFAGIFYCLYDNTESLLFGRKKFIEFVQNFWCLSIVFT